MYAYFQMNIFVFNGQLNQPNNKPICLWTDCCVYLVWQGMEGC